MVESRDKFIEGVSVLGGKRCRSFGETRVVL